MDRDDNEIYKSLLLGDIIMIERRTGLNTTFETSKTSIMSESSQQQLIVPHFINVEPCKQVTWDWNHPMEE